MATSCGSIGKVSVDLYLRNTPLVIVPFRPVRLNPPFLHFALRFFVEWDPVACPLPLSSLPSIHDDSNWWSRARSCAYSRHGSVALLICGRDALCWAPQLIASIGTGLSLRYSLIHTLTKIGIVSPFFPTVFNFYLVERSSYCPPITKSERERKKQGPRCFVVRCNRYYTRSSLVVGPFRLFELELSKANEKGQWECQTYVHWNRPPFNGAY